jgi:hypothetical protein
MRGGEGEHGTGVRCNGTCIGSLLLLLVCHSPAAVCIDMCPACSQYVPRQRTDTTEGAQVADTVNGWVWWVLTQ